MSRKTVVFTIIAKNYLPFARSLMDSMAEHHPDFVRSVVLVDTVDGYFDPSRENFELLSSRDLGIPQPDWFHFKYTVLELSTAVKPWAFEILFERHQADRVIYLDPDIRVYRPMAPLIETMERSAIVLTPHLTDPMDDALLPTELNIRQSGTYNLGFVALSAGDTARRLLPWWQGKLYDDCVVDIQRGVFVDQSWMDLAPAIFPECAILRHPGFNVAYWNIKQRPVHSDSGGYTAQGQPLYFFHFSGFDPMNPEPFSKHQNRLRLSDLGGGRELVLDYAQAVIGRGYPECRKWPYSYATFRNGVRIVDMGRQLYREAPGLEKHISDPFSDEGYRAFLEFWNEPLLDASGRGANLTRMAYNIYRRRTDLRAAMPDVWGLDRLPFLQWMVARAQDEHDIPEDLIQPVQKALEVAKAQQPLEFGRLRYVSEKERVIQQASDPGGRPQPTRLAQAIWRSRPDLHQAFPDPFGGDGARYLQWLLIFGKEEYKLDETVLGPVRRQWKAAVKASGRWPEQVKQRAGYTALAAAARARRAMDRATRAFHRPPATAAPRTLVHAPAARWASAKIAVASNGQPPQLGINLIGYVRSELSIGESGRLAAVAARAAGLPVSLKNIGYNNPYRQQDFRAGGVDHVFPYPFNLFHVNADQMPGVAEQLVPHMLEGRYNIGYWAWELDLFPDEWLPAFTYLDEIWAPSTFCVEALSKRSPVPVVRMPHAIAVEAPEGVGRARFGIPDEAFIFVTIFDLLSVIERKNPHGLVEAFRRAFEGDPRYHLVVKVSNGHHRPVELEKLRAACDGLPVSVIDEVISRDEINALIACCDCLVSLHRAEGFGLTLAEAMYLGKPVVATAYSGNMDFTSAETAFLVNYELKRVGPGAEPYPAEGQWAEPSIEDAARQLRTVAERPDERSRIAAAGQALIRARFAPEVVGQRMRERLEHLLEHRLTAGK